MPGTVAANYEYWQDNGDFWIREYEKRRRLVPRYGMQEIAISSIVSQNLPAKVLEFGCGVGRHLSYLSKLPGIELYGADQSPTMLAGVSAYAGEGSLISTCQIDPTGKIPYQDRFFDVVFTVEVLVHVRPVDLIGRLEELLRICKRSIFHLEPHSDAELAATAHEGCWYHDLVLAYAQLGLSARRVARPVEAQELIIVDVDPKRPLTFPPAAFFQHVCNVEGWMQAAIDSKTTPIVVEPDPAAQEREQLTRQLKSVEPSSEAAATDYLKRLPEEFRAQVDRRKRELEWTCDRGALPLSAPRSDWILDWECGNCAFAVAMLLAGAKFVIAADSWLDRSRLPDELFSMPGLIIAKLDIAGVEEALKKNNMLLDFVFSNTVTEHIQDLPGAFSAIRRILKPGGHYFTNHDNYFQPAGSHDHGFLFYGSDSDILFQGVRCWESPEKCAASAEHRARIEKELPWTWSPGLDATRDPTCCENCFYYRRAQPWAHLLNQNEFLTYFGNPTFTTGRERSTLNKATLFQLRQLVVEAGFDIVRFNRIFIKNEPPPALLDEPFFFHEKELRTSTATIFARKPEQT